MRALFYVDNAHRMAGSQRSLLAALTHSEAFGLRPIVVATLPGPFVDGCRAAGIEVRMLEGSRAFQTFGGELLRLGPVDKARMVLGELLPFAYRLAKVIDQERAEIVHFNTLRPVVTMGMAAHLARRGVVFHLRGTIPVGPALWTFTQSITHRFIPVARALEAELLPSSLARSGVVYNGVSSPLPIPEPRRFWSERFPEVERTHQGTPIVLSLSSLVPFKGLHHLVKAASILRQRGVVARFVLAGIGHEDAYEAELRRLPEALGVADLIHFVGFTDEVPRALSAADVLALPSVRHETLEIAGRAVQVSGNEGLPRSVLETMNYGCVAVASDVAGVREQIIDGETGLVVPPGDPLALADALESVLADPERRSRMAGRARERVRELFSVESAARGLVKNLAIAAREATAFASVKNLVSAFAEGAAVQLNR